MVQVPTGAVSGGISEYANLAHLMVLLGGESPTLDFHPALGLHDRLLTPKVRSRCGKHTRTPDSARLGARYVKRWLKQ
jgi:hypothetical protein